MALVDKVKKIESTHSATSPSEIQETQDQSQDKFDNLSQQVQSLIKENYDLKQEIKTLKTQPQVTNL